MRICGDKACTDSNDLLYILNTVETVKLKLAKIRLFLPPVRKSYL